MNSNISACMVVILLLLASFAGLGCTSTDEQNEENQTQEVDIEENVQALRDTNVTFEDITINEISTDQIDLTITVSIFNPNDVTVELERMEYDIYANDVRIASGSFEEPLEIPPNEEVTTSTTVVAPISTVPSAILGILTEGEANWSIEGTMYFNTPDGTVEQTFSREIEREGRT
ncbi:LEA type 2 family protein [Methanolobus sp. ZRKC2]|uniref:LEA type 2 family protein n=1 Tax=Methanolobus sp. ZRKC2 TaxID=3125783 RepID=UPI00324CF182